MGRIEESAEKRTGGGALPPPRPSGIEGPVPPRAVEPGWQTPAHRWWEVGPVRIGSLVSGGGPPVVLLHGLAGSRRWWRATVPPLARAYEVHVPELFALRGDDRRVATPRLSRLVRLLADWLRLLDRGSVALIATHIAAHHPDLVRRLVLVDSTGLPRNLTPGELLRFSLGFVTPAAWGSPTFLPTIGVDSLRAGPTRLLTAFHSILTDDVRPLLPRISVPTAVVWGELDPLVPLAAARMLAASIPGARLHLIPGAAHNPMIDRPDAFNRLLMAILAGELD
jgi:pimeloyl-ACP methyl ester carboxylesterase